MIDFGKCNTPLDNLCSTSASLKLEACPKSISRRTSYLRARLESPGSIGISPLSTSHPRAFQRSWVRSSTKFYFRFNLLMDRSPGFGSTSSNLVAHLRLAFATAPHLKCLTLLLNVTRWPVLQKVRGHTSNVLPQLVSARLEFHRYPQVIPELFNARGFGPPRNFTFASTCSWIGRPVSGLRQLTKRPFKTRFRYGSTP